MRADLVFFASFSRLYSGSSEPDACFEKKASFIALAIASPSVSFANTISSSTGSSIWLGENWLLNGNADFFRLVRGNSILNHALSNLNPCKSRFLWKNGRYRNCCWSHCYSRHGAPCRNHDCKDILLRKENA